MNTPKVLTRSVATLLSFGALISIPATSSYGDVRIWDGNGVGDVNLGLAANWGGDTLPSVTLPDTAQWDGTFLGPLSLSYSDAAFTGVAGNAGLNFSLTSGQADALTIDSGPNTNTLRLNNIAIATGAGAFTLGNGVNTFNLTLGGNGGQTHTWTNDSTNAATLASDVVTTVDAGAHTLALAGSGNWVLNNVLGQGSGTLALTKSGTGSLTLGGANTYNGGLTLNAGTLYLNNAGALGNTAAGALTIAGNSTIDNTSGAVITTVAAKNIALNANLTFAGSNGLNFNGGNLALGGAAGTRNLAVTGNTLSVGTLTGGAGLNLTKTGAGTLFITSLTNNASTMQGILDVQAGKVQIQADLTSGGIAGPGTIEIGGTASKWLFDNQNVDTEFSGSYQGGAAAGVRLGLVKRGTGTLTFSGVGGTGANTMDYFAVENGKVVLTNTTLMNVGGVNLGSTNVGNVANQNGILEINGGTLNALRTTNPGFTVGAGNNARGFVKMNSGTLAVTEQLKIGNASAAGSNAYGAFTMNGGTVTSGSWIVVGLNNDRSVLNQNGGSITVNTNRMTIGAGGNASIGVANLSGGSFNVAAGGSTGIFLGENGIGTLNLSGTSALTLNTNGGANSGTMQFGGNATSLGGTFNLNGGTLTTFGITKGASTAGAIYNFDFNGGTLKANADNVSFFALLPNTTAYVYGGGAVIDDGGFAVTIGQPLTAPFGSGVSTIGVAGGGAGYLDMPIVTLSGGSGTGATAVANVSGGVVTGFTITNPGSGYLPGEVLTATLFGGGATAAATAGTITLAPNVSGGLTKTGGGTLTLSNANNYSGATTINAGKLRIDALGSINSSSGININGPTAKLIQTSLDAISSPVTLTNGILDGTGTINSVTVGNGTGGIITTGDGGTAPLTIGNLTFNGAATINLKTGPSFSAQLLTTGLTTSAAGPVAINVSNANGLWTAGIYDLISYSTLGGQGFAGFTKGTIAGLGARQAATLTNPAGLLSLSITGDLPIWTGAANGNWTISAIPGAKNWKLQTGGTSTDFITGDTVVFDDSATGTTSLNISDANVSATSITFNNSGSDYSVGSSGGFGISGGQIVKNGTAVLSLGTPNTYAGGTVLNEGILALNHLSALGTGTLTINGGSIDNTSGNPIVLNTNNVNIWNAELVFNGTNDLNLGTGSVALAANRTISTGGSATLTVGGAINGTGFGVTKNGSGTLKLDGASTYTGVTSISDGTVKLTGAINSANVGNIGQVTVGDTFGANAILEIAGGTINATKTTSPSFAIGAANSSNGFVRMGSGTINTTSEFHIGRGTGAYGAVTMSGGAINTGNWLVVGFNNDHSVLNQSGGNIAVNTNRMTIGAGGAGAIGVVNLSGGTFTSAAGANTGIYVGENGGGIMTLTGTSSVTLNTNGTANSGTLQFAGAATSTSGIFNLNGGTLTAFGVTKGVSDASGLYSFNFNGGTLKANASNTAFFAPLAGTSAFVQPGGATIDTNGFDVTISQPLLSPAASGVNSIEVGDGGSGYLDTPVVLLSGGSGFGATAVANISGGVITGYTITNPGSGYLPDDVLFVSLYGGGATVPATPGNVTLAANASGGLIKNGAGILTLSGDNTYTGATNVNAGTLRIANTAGSATGTGPINLNAAGRLTGVGTMLGTLSVASGGKLEPGDGGIGTLTVGGLTLNAGSVLTYEWDNALTNDRIVVTGSNGLTINGGVVSLLNAGGSAVFGSNGVYNLIGYTGAITGLPSNLTVAAASQLAGKSYTFGTAAGFVTLQIATAGVVANFWNVNANGNWTTSANWTDGVPPNAAEAFANFGGGGTPITVPRTVTLDANQTVGSISFNSAQPFNIAGSSTLTLNNAANAATITVTQGSHTLAVPLVGNSPGVQFNIVNAPDTLVVGPISGTTSISKFGAGSLVLNASNSFSGTTTINVGKITIAGTGTLGNTGNGLVVNAGELDLGGTTQTIGTTSFASGAISNGILIPTSFTFNGTATGTANVAIAGGTGVTKNGTGTLVLAGNNSYTGTTAVNAGTVAITNNNSLGGAGSPVTFGADSILQVNGTSATSLGTRAITGFPASVIISDIDNSFSIDQAIAANGTLVKQGPGTLRMKGVGTYSSTASSSIQAGHVIFDGGSFTGANVTSNIGIEIAPTNDSVAEMTVQNGAVVNTNRVIIGGNTANNAGGAAVLTMTSGTINSAQWFHVGHAGTGNGVFNMSGGTLNVNSAGGTQIEIGAFNSASGTMNLSGGTVNLLNNGNFNLGNINNGTGSGSVHQTGGVVNFFSDAGTTLGGTGGLRLGGGTGRTGTFTYDLSGGELRVPVITRTSGSGILNLNGGILRPTGSNADFIGLSILTYVQTGGAVLDVGAGSTVTITGSLTHDFALGEEPDGGLRKLGAGTLAMAGFSDYTGPTIVEAGTLAVSGTLSGTKEFRVKSGAVLDASAGTGLIIDSGKKLSGGGSVIGQVALSEGAFLSPGESAGTLTFANNVDLSLALTPASSAALLFELGTTSDRGSLTVGTLSIGDGVMAFDDFNFTALGGFTAGTYTLFDTTTSILGSLAATGLSGAIGTLSGTLALADNNSDIILVVVPEPNICAVLLTGTAALVGGRRRRCRTR